MVIGGTVLCREETRAGEQILEAYQRTYALVQRMLVANHGASAVSGACGGGELAVTAIELLDLRFDCSRHTAIVDDIVGAREALAARKLRRHDRAHF